MFFPYLVAIIFIGGLVLKTRMIFNNFLTKIRQKRRLFQFIIQLPAFPHFTTCLLYTSWAAIETILYSSGRKLHFKKRGDLPEIRAKQSTRGLVIDSSQSGLIVKYGKVTIPCKYKAKDLWLWDEEKAILAYLAEAELQDAHAVDQMSKGIITDTYRPCFASLVCKKIRGQLRVYVHITVEGKAISKRRKDSTPRPVSYTHLGNIRPGQNHLIVCVDNLWDATLAPRGGEHQFNGGI